MNRKLTILMASQDAIGHVNAAIGIAEVLRDSGHRIVFAIEKSWEGKLIKYGFEEELFTDPERDSNKDSAKFWSELFVGDGSHLRETSHEKKLRDIILPVLSKLAKRVDPILGEIIERIKPDVIIIDQYFTIPSINKSGIPWVLTCSFNPLMFINDERTPPNSSGFPAIGCEVESNKFRQELNASVHQTWIDYNDYVINSGLEPLVRNRFLNDSPYLNIYGFPLELDYLDLRPLPPKWVRFDNLKRTESKEHFEIPEVLKNKTGKLIYFSMGSMGSADLNLMNRLLSILSKSPHRFIVSKGPLHQQYELSDNMWGQQTVPQIQVLPVVDLVITHGGNNTVSETFYFGKPMIVMPLFGDQYDNAQRIEEKGFGVRLDPYRCQEKELLDSIEVLLNDIKLNESLGKASKRIQTENNICKLPEMLLELLKCS